MLLISPAKLQIIPKTPNESQKNGWHTLEAVIRPQNPRKPLGGKEAFQQNGEFLLERGNDIAVAGMAIADDLADFTGQDDGFEATVLVVLHLFDGRFVNRVGLQCGLVGHFFATACETCVILRSSTLSSRTICSAIFLPTSAARL